MLKVAILQYARIDSKRVPRKLLQRVGGKTLLTRGLRKLGQLADEDEHVTPFLLVPRTDREILAETSYYPRIRVLLSDETPCGSSRTDATVRPHLQALQEFDWVWNSNILCRPFLQLSTLRSIVRLCREQLTPFVLTHQQRGLVFDEESRTVIGAQQLADTRSNPLYQTLSHMGYGWPTEFLAESDEQLAARSSPVPIELSPFERVDIDTPADLDFAQKIAGAVFSK